LALSISTILASNQLKESIHPLSKLVKYYTWTLKIFFPLKDLQDLKLKVQDLQEAPEEDSEAEEALVDVEVHSEDVVDHSVVVEVHSAVEEDHSEDEEEEEADESKIEMINDTIYLNHLKFLRA
jgi:hypothetical protein